MRKFHIILLLALALAVLCACSDQSDGSYEVTYQDRVYRVDPEERAIQSDGVVYRYQTSQSAFTVVYPDGSEWAIRVDQPFASGSTAAAPARRAAGRGPSCWR